MTTHSLLGRAARFRRSRDNGPLRDRRSGAKFVDAFRGAHPVDVTAGATRSAGAQRPWYLIAGTGAF